jgi:8-oxo-dGTP pyrophosphatase MutT (NUDIX family)/phosphohistidine phosphatase SixA
METVLAVARPTEGALLVSDLIEAAGGVVLRGSPGDREILMIHRPEHDDWTLPKGKLEDGEDHAEAALREVAEETGWRCVTGPWLPEVRYLDPRARPKRVRFRVMRPAAQGSWTPSNEVDEIRWVSMTRAPEELTYPSDRRVLAAAAALDEPIYLIRHAKASLRETWEADDDLRPLTGKGRRQAARLREHLGLDRLRHIVSSPAVRCAQTVQPMARELDLDIEEIDVLREGTAAGPALRSLQALAGPSAACTHGDVMFEAVEAIARAHPIDGPIGWKKGSTWIIERDGGDPAGVRYVPPPPVGTDR